jgi:hypothetical protein
MARQEYEAPDPLETAFSDKELKGLLELVRQMTPGVAIVPAPKPGEAGHLVDIVVGSDGVPDEEKPAGLETVAAHLRWGDSILLESLSIKDRTLRTKVKQRLANAAAIAWFFNNAELFLTEMLQAREALRSLDLVNRAVAQCIACDNDGDPSCRVCSGRNELDAKEAREMQVSYAERTFYGKKDSERRRRVPRKATE